MKFEGEMIGASPRNEQFTGDKVPWAGVPSCLCHFLGERKKETLKPDQSFSWRIHFPGTLALMAVKSIKLFFLYLGNYSQAPVGLSLVK